MNIQLLNDGWHAAESAPGAQLSEPQWIPLPVPGDINTALVKHGRMPDPHFDTDARDCYWVTSKDWWCSLDFSSAASFRSTIRATSLATASINFSSSLRKTPASNSGVSSR